MVLEEEPPQAVQQEEPPLYEAPRYDPAPTEYSVEENDYSEPVYQATVVSSSWV